MMGIYREHTRQLSGKRGGYKMSVINRHRDMAERCDMREWEKRSILCKALDSLDRAVKETPLPVGNPYRELAVCVLRRGEEGNIALYRKGQTSRTRAEEQATIMVDNTRERLVREGNAPPVKVEGDRLQTALLRLLKAVRVAEGRGVHPLLSEAQALSSFSPKEAVEYFTDEEKAIKIIHHVANTLTA